MASSFSTLDWLYSLLALLGRHCRGRCYRRIYWACPRRQCSSTAESHRLESGGWQVISVTDSRIVTRLGVARQNSARTGSLRPPLIKRVCDLRLSTAPLPEPQPLITHGFESQGRVMDLNHRPSGYEPDELPDCSNPSHMPPVEHLRPSGEPPNIHF